MQWWPEPASPRCAPTGASLSPFSGGPLVSPPAREGVSTLAFVAGVCFQGTASLRAVQGCVWVSSPFQCSGLSSPGSVLGRPCYVTLHICTF